MELSFPLIIGIALIVIFVLIFFHYVPFFLWINALSANVRISLVQLFLMRLRRVPPHTQGRIEKRYPGQPGSALPGRRARGTSCPCACFGIKSQHRTAFPDGHSH